MLGYFFILTVLFASKGIECKNYDVIFITYFHYSHILQQLPYARELSKRDSFDVYFPQMWKFENLIKREGNIKFFNFSSPEGLQYYCEKAIRVVNRNPENISIKNVLVMKGCSSTRSFVEHNKCVFGKVGFLERMKLTKNILELANDDVLGMKSTLINFLRDRKSASLKTTIVLDSILSMLWGSLVVEYPDLVKNVNIVWNKVTLVADRSNLDDNYYPSVFSFRTMDEIRQSYWHGFMGFMERLVAVVYFISLHSLSEIRLLLAQTKAQDTGTSLVNSIQEADILSKSSARVEYVGFIGVAKDNDRIHGVDEISTEVAAFLENSYMENKNVVYLAYGSLWCFEEDVVNKILTKLLVQSEDFNVIFSIRNDTVNMYSENFWKQFSTKKLLVVHWVNQWKLLNEENISFMITHGGVGSVTECIVTKTPMFVVPQCFDQWRHSSWIKNSGIGERVISIEELEDEYILQVFQNLANRNNSKYISNLEKFQKLSELSGGAKKAADVIEKIARFGNIQRMGKRFGFYDSYFMVFCANVVAIIGLIVLFSIKFNVVFGYSLVLAIFVVFGILLRCLWKRVKKKSERKKKKRE